jgi:hypothetical protein
MRVSESIRVLLFPIDNHDRRQDAEFIQNNGYRREELESVLPNDVLSFSLNDFMDACNNQEINLEGYWVSYINVIDEMEEHNHNIEIVIKSCEEGRDGDWDCSTTEGKEGFDDMITLLEKCFVK